MPAPAAASYAAPAVISLGEEYTDETLPQTQTSYISLEEDEAEEEEGFDYYDDNNDDSSDEGDYSPISTSSPSPTAMHGQQLGAIPALWHAEHARLKHIQAAVLDNEREARSRELKLESEVARIKDDLARLKEARAQSSSSTATGPFNLSAPPSSSRVSMPMPTSSSKPITSPNSAQAPPQQRACGPRGPRPRPQQQSQSNRTSSASSSTVEVSSAATIPSVQAPPSHSNSVEWSNNSSSPPSIPASLLGKFAFEEDDDTTETVLSMNLTEARSARAQERQRRKKENERIRELSMLLTLGSEVRKWEERLAWQQARAMASTPSSDDMNLESSTKSSNMDTDPDPRVKRLSRSSSLPSRGSYNPTAAPSPAVASTSSTSNNGATANNRSGPPSPALPSLAMSPLWRVSAEMILRRRSLSERPRRMPPKPLLPKATTPAVPVPAPEQKVQVQLKPQQPQSQHKESSTLSRSTSNATSPTKSGSGLARPGHVLRGPRERNSVSSNLASAPTVAAAAASTAAAATSSTAASPSSISTLSQNATGVSSASSSPSSGKRYSVPPPITIPPNSQFCTSTTAAATGTGNGATVTTTGAALRLAGQAPSANMANGTTTFLLSKTTPVRPSALKWAFTADDLARERELEARTQEEADLKADQLSDSASSSSEGESDDSRQSSSCDSSSSSSDPGASQCVERRGRARFSWRKSLPKDSNNAQPVANT